MEETMEYLLHYVWQHRLYGLSPLTTDMGQAIDVIDPGVHNLHQSGPDFFNAKVKIDGLLWVGNVEIHERASDWFRHGHHLDAAYNNVVLHVVGTNDAEATTNDGKRPPQLLLGVPEELKSRYAELLNEERYPPCYRVIPSVSMLVVHSWLSRLSVERLEEKTVRFAQYVSLANGNRESAFFMMLARNFGFGTNAQAFEMWARSIDLAKLGKHRDDVFQVEAYFMGQAGLLNDDLVKDEHKDEYFNRLKREYTFLSTKFSLRPMDAHVWKFGRLRPQNFPYVRLSQLTKLYCEHDISISRVLETTEVKALRELFRVGVTDYWRRHYAFGEESSQSDKRLQTASLNLLLINTVAPLFFAYGRERDEEILTDGAFAILENLPAEHNYITRQWELAGVKAENAADSQALFRLRTHYCDRKDCLRCRFGAEYLRCRTTKE